MEENIRILLVDDHPVVREGLQVVLNRSDKLTVVASVNSGEQAISAYDNTHPDVVLMDVNLPEIDGIETLVKILKRDPKAKVILLTSYTHDDDLRVAEALDKGAMGYLIKNSAVTELIRAIHSAYANKHTLAPEAVKSLIRNRHKPEVANQRLTPRETNVLTLIVDGQSNREIGSALSISESTVKSYAAKIYKKLNVKSRAEAIAKAIKEQMVELN